MPARAPRATLAMLVVQDARALSNEIAARFSIRHESPQVILFVEGKPTGVLNHGDVTVDQMTALLSGGKTPPQ
jgi:bacillithiol system protein YtxJ